MAPTAALWRRRRGLLPLVAAALAAAACVLALPGACAQVVPEVVGGQTAPQGRFKHQVAVLIDMGGQGYLCGGSLVSTNTVVTAGHCAYDAALGRQLPPQSFSVVVGAYGKPYDPGNGGGTTVGVSSVHLHPQYNDGSRQDPYIYNDISVLKLSSHVSLGSTVGTIKLASADEITAARYSNWGVTGWGVTGSARGNLADNLQYGVLKLVDPSHPYCSKQVPPRLEYSLLCAGDVPPVSPGVQVQDSCQGDSGGPLFFNVGSPSSPVAGIQADDRLVGVVSSGNGCGKQKSPGLYTLAYNYKAWVECIAATSGPCDATPGNATWHFEDASATRAWAGAPDATLKLPPKLPPGGRKAAWCQSRCDQQAARKPAAVASCAATSVTSVQSLRAGGAPQDLCQVFLSPPARLCEAGEAAGVCGQVAAGSQRVVFG